MKNRHTFLLVSVTLNVACFGFGLRFLSVRPETNVRMATGSTEMPSETNPPTSLAPADGVFQWSVLDSTNYSIFIENLQQIGCPQQTIDDIVVAEINRLYAMKMATAQERVASPQHYWQPQNSWSKQLEELQTRLAKEKNLVLKQLLGISMEDYFRGGFLPFQSRNELLAFLPEAKRKALISLQVKYRDLESKIYSSAHGLITGEDQAALSALERQRTAELDALLTTEEKLEYSLRNSPTADSLRQSLATFQPSEAEFRAIYQAQIVFEESARAIHDTNSSGTSVDPEKEFASQLKSALGDQRYAEYQRSQNQDFKLLLRVVDRFGLPEDVAGQIFNLKQEAELQREQVLTNADFDSDQKTTFLQDLHDQTASALSGMMGDSAYSAYRDYSGSWIDRLKK